MSRTHLLAVLALALAGCCQVPDGAYRDGFKLYVRAVQAPPKKPGGLDWDAGRLVAGLIKVAAFLSGDVQTALDSLGPGVGTLLTEEIGKTAAPDLRVVVSAYSRS